MAEALRQLLDTDRHDSRIFGPCANVAPQLSLYPRDTLERLGMKSRTRATIRTGGAVMRSAAKTQQLEQFALAV